MRAADTETKRRRESLDDLGSGGNNARRGRLDPDQRQYSNGNSWAGGFAVWEPDHGEPEPAQTTTTAARRAGDNEEEDMEATEAKEV
jgi:hypothetical protein